MSRFNNNWRKSAMEGGVVRLRCVQEVSLCCSFPGQKRREVFNLLIVRPSVEKRRHLFLNLGPYQFNINDKIIILN